MSPVLELVGEPAAPAAVGPQRPTMDDLVGASDPQLGADRPVGHRRLLTLLEDGLPSVSLFLGPSSVGKRTVAEWVVRQYSVMAVDVRFYGSLTADVAREIRRFALLAPMGHTKVIIVRLDDATVGAQNIVLKTLGEPPAHVRVLLLSSRVPLATIVSRSCVYRFGYLERGELAEVLGRLGQSKVLPVGGQVQPALDRREEAVRKHTVLAALRPIVRDDTHAIDKLLGDWTHETHHLLKVWCVEALTNKWAVFSLQEAQEFQMDRSVVRRLLLAASASGRPRFVLRTLPSAFVRFAKEDAC